MKFLIKKLLTKNSLKFWIYFLKVKIFILRKYNIIFYKYKTLFEIFFNYFYFIKSLTWKVNSLYIVKKDYKLKNFSFQYLLRIKQIMFTFLTSCYTIFILKGRGFRFLYPPEHKSVLLLKLGSSHLISLRINNNLEFKSFLKNFQKFGFQGSIFQIIQIYSCLYFLYKKNIYINKGIFFIREKLKKNKFIKKSW